MAIGMTFTCVGCRIKVDVLWDEGRDELLADSKGNLYCTAQCFNRHNKMKELVKR
jgi:hypothetical protein